MHGVDKDRMFVNAPDVGGGFGTKTFVYREYPLVLEAAKRLKRPVKWIADRADHFIGDAHGRDNITTAEVAVDKSGKFLAMRFDIIGNLGAYASQFGPYIHYLCASMMTGVYKTPLIAVKLRAVYTNTVPVDAYRGAGRPEAPSPTPSPAPTSRGPRAKRRRSSASASPTPDHPGS